QLATPTFSRLFLSKHDAKDSPKLTHYPGVYAETDMICGTLKSTKISAAPLEPSMQQSLAFL
ncbi:MAG TPA: hypothetical protein VGA09_18220, partial [Candidatus Binatia bacterium]